MIQFRLRSAGLPDGRRLFTPDAVRVISRATQGYPRQIALLCHNAMEALVIHDKTVVDEALVEDLLHEDARWVYETASRGETP